MNPFRALIRSFSGPSKNDLRKQLRRTQRAADVRSGIDAVQEAFVQLGDVDVASVGRRRCASEQPDGAL